MVLWLKPWESRSLPGLQRTRNPPLSMFEYKTPLPQRRYAQREAAFLFVLTSADGAASAGLSRPRPLRTPVRIDHRHADAFGRAHRHRGRIEILETEYVDSKMIRRGALAMKRVDADSALVSRIDCPPPAGSGFSRAWGSQYQEIVDAVLVAKRSAAGKAISGGMLNDNGRLSFSIVVISGDDIKQMRRRPSRTERGYPQRWLVHQLG